MNVVRKIDRTYTFSERDVREALIAAMKKKDLQAPQYVGNTPSTTWTTASDGSSVTAAI